MKTLLFPSAKDRTRYLQDADAKKKIDEDYSQIMIGYVQEMSACHLYPTGHRTQRRIKRDLVKILVDCFATTKK